MFKVYISDSIYQTIITSEENKAPSEQSYLYKLLKKQPIQILKPEDEKNIKENPASVLDNPSAVYILNITPAEALAIQQSYGVMCLSGESLNIGKLIDVNDDQTVNQYERLGKGWDTVLNSVEKLPSSAVIITDRYLFKDEKRDYGNGFDNIKAILYEILPQQFKGGEYHVTIIFDNREKYEKYTFNGIARKLEEIKQKLGREYPIMMEVLGIAEDKETYYRLHNRRIYSNYFVVKMDHKIAAFNENKSTTEQSIIPQQLFTLNSLNGKSTPPLKSISQIISTLRSFSKYISTLTDHSVYFYAVNGKRMKRCYGIKNRLLK